MGIEIGRAPEDLGRNLILLERDARVLDGVVGEITQQLAERLGPVQGMTAY
jgi:pyruvate/2-oxoglutarate dehydrogenase complex dihydrolipoamide dehydrogenase (E3) component